MKIINFNTLMDDDISNINSIAPSLSYNPRKKKDVPQKRGKKEEDSNTDEDIADDINILDQDDDNGEVGHNLDIDI